MLRWTVWNTNLPSASAVSHTDILTFIVGSPGQCRPMAPMPVASFNLQTKPGMRSANALTRARFAKKSFMRGSSGPPSTRPMLTCARCMANAAFCLHCVACSEDRNHTRIFFSDGFSERLKKSRVEILADVATNILSLAEPIVPLEIGVVLLNAGLYPLTPNAIAAKCEPAALQRGQPQIHRPIVLRAGFQLL